MTHALLRDMRQDAHALPESGGPLALASDVQPGVCSRQKNREAKAAAQLGAKGERSDTTPWLILSLFPGADLLGRGFEAEGFTVVRGPDLLWGQDVRSLSLVRHARVFEGIIGGPPCQDFSSARRHGHNPKTGDGDRAIAEFCRLVTEAEPDWALMENVVRVPNVEIPGYSVQRFNLDARDCGCRQRRLRRFQFFSRDGTRHCHF